LTPEFVSHSSVGYRDDGAPDFPVHRQGSTNMNWRKIAVVMLACTALHAAASNVTDHWYSPSESGWGASVTQQADTAFIVMFVYGASKEPMWLHAAATRYGTSEGGHPGFAGPLYRTSGPWHGGPFDPSAVNAVRVGDVTFEATETNRAILAYSVNGVATSKVVERLTFRYKDWSGLYRGVARFNYRDCAAQFTPPAIYDDGLIDVEHEGTAFRMWFDGKKAACMFTGTYEQQGRVGKAGGTYTCADGPSGTFTLSGLESHERAFGGRIETTHPSCGRVYTDVAGFALTSA
jgi:hypothetical protein